MSIHHRVQENKRRGRRNIVFSDWDNKMVTQIVNNLTSVSAERICYYCRSPKTYLVRTEKGKIYPKWYHNPLKEDTWICAKCIKNLAYHNKLPAKHVRTAIRIDAITKRTCYKCGGNTTTQKSKTSSYNYHIWHRHPEVVGEWLCGKCYANLLFEPKRRFKTRKERYEYMSKFFSGRGNPMYGDHTTNLGRTYTAERNKKVAAASRRWIAEHPDEHRMKGVKGALQARKLGLFRLSTKLENKMEEALKKYNISYRLQQEFEIGIMDFYLPEGNIAVFVDGDVWHANPKKYKGDDVLFYGKIATSIWMKDLYHNRYLKSCGFRVLRFWEEDINRNIDACIKKILESLKARNTNRK
jgi:DNA mismatch endonuclease (patch repair protein)